MSNDKVHCQTCKIKVSPRLLHAGHNSFIFNRSTEHLCPLCGETMYRTGGGWSTLSKVIVVLFIAQFVTVLLGGLLVAIGEMPVPFQVFLASIILIPLWKYNKKTGKLSLWLIETKDFIIQKLKK